MKNTVGDVLAICTDNPKLKNELVVLAVSVLPSQRFLELP